MQKNVPVERDKYRKGALYPGFQNFGKTVKIPYFLKWVALSVYLISKFEGTALIGGRRRLKGGGVYFKVRRITYM